MKDQKIDFQAAGKAASLYPADTENRTLIVLNEYEGDGSGIVREMREIGCNDLSLLVVSGIDWEREMTPWASPAVFPNEPPYAGEADRYLQDLTGEILKTAIGRLKKGIRDIRIAGYSLAGLFALYALHETGVFSGAASCSGSLWYPDFMEYIKSRPMKRTPEKLYLSLGDREARTNNPVTRTVGEHTEELYRYYRERGIDVTFEWNPGNHFKDAERRIAKGIRALVS